MTALIAASQPTLRQALRIYGRIGLLSFGGPAGQIALMHRELVQEREWISDADFLMALNFCHLLPGPEAQQLATWIGWRLHGTLGGLAAGMLFILPGAAVMLILSIFYALAADLAWFEALFLGVKSAVLAIVVQALLRIAGRALVTRLQQALALGALLGLAVLALPFPLVILIAGLLGMLAAFWQPGWLPSGHDNATQGPLPPRPWRASFAALVIWGMIWAAPLAAIWLLFGDQHVLWQIGIFFSQLALVTFGGAYAVLAYMAQEAVSGYGWLQAGEMADGLGLAETTPGPLILVTQFVGFLAAYRDAAPFSPLVAGIIGSAVTLWVTFAPCFLWIFALAPWIDRLRHAAILRGALAAIGAAVVGVIANLTWWFALHLIFQQVERQSMGPLHFDLPIWSSFDARVAALALLAGVGIFLWRWSILRTVAVLAATGLVTGLIFA